MPSRRCPRCLLEFPAGSIKQGKKVYEFKQCPDCGEGTWSSLSGTAMSHSEAIGRCLRAEFKTFYRKWDRARKGPSPDELGRAEAQEIIALEQSLSAAPPEPPAMPRQR